MLTPWKVNEVCLSIAFIFYAHPWRCMEDWQAFGEEVQPQHERRPDFLEVKVNRSPHWSYWSPHWSSLLTQDDIEMTAEWWSWKFYRLRNTFISVNQSKRKMIEDSSLPQSNSFLMRWLFAFSLSLFFLMRLLFHCILNVLRAECSSSWMFFQLNEREGNFFYAKKRKKVMVEEYQLISRVTKYMQMCRPFSFLHLNEFLLYVQTIVSFFMWRDYAK